ncbi:hypothetical protein A359_08890 [secondary endosymbiont of Ctenarytaina eucalypti]|uniref:Lipopolysaccharide export system protein LptC n=2 Tax=secondary endosymbiont of Ctenarytaina eucalypti TaxID=1199245 RepID=J3TY45_9ENTR|nr:hypothetical protein A359_08890 [secondary endosymbiont of Ctenarytaina eucalypti]
MHWITALLGLLILALIIWNMMATDSIQVQEPVKSGEPTYQSEYITTLAYNSAGSLHYTLSADHVQYFSEGKITWLTRPVATIIDDDKVPTWTVKADRAKLIQDRMLYLYGHVQADSLTEASKLKHITTANALIDLFTQEISSDDEVIVYGANFNSTGMKMRGNLRNKTAELLEKVKTSYAIENAERTS